MINKVTKTTSLRLLQISKIHSNFAQTQAMVENFRSLHSRLDDIEYLMQEDGLRNLGNSPFSFCSDGQTCETRCQIFSRSTAN